ncbi:hypothetical protein Ancab_003891, partial [Ancistrocladus abbreviatus]
MANSCNVKEGKKERNWEHGHNSSRIDLHQSAFRFEQKKGDRPDLCWAIEELGPGDETGNTARPRTSPKEMHTEGIYDLGQFKLDGPKRKGRKSPKGPKKTKSRSKSKSGLHKGDSNVAHN